MKAVNSWLVREFMCTSRSDRITTWDVRCLSSAKAITQSGMTTYLEYSLTISSAPADSKLKRKTSNVGVEIFVIRRHMSRSYWQIPASCAWYHWKQDGSPIWRSKPVSQYQINWDYFLKLSDQVWSFRYYSSSSTMVDLLIRSFCSRISYSNCCWFITARSCLALNCSCISWIYWLLVISCWLRMICCCCGRCTSCQKLLSALAQVVVSNNASNFVFMVNRKIDDYIV